MARRSAEKFHGPYTDVLDMLKQAFDPHSGHRFTRSIDEEDPECLSVYCHDCELPVVMGSRELIDMIWLDLFAGPPRSH
jgi:hypothetical protein